MLFQGPHIGVPALSLGVETPDLEIVSSIVRMPISFFNSSDQLLNAGHHCEVRQVALFLGDVPCGFKFHPNVEQADASPSVQAVEDVAASLRVQWDLTTC